MIKDDVERLIQAFSNRQMVDLVHLVKRIADESHPAVLGRSRVVVLPAVPDLVGWWHSARLKRMLANVIDNALKYNRHDRPVIVALTPAAGCPLLLI